MLIKDCTSLIFSFSNDCYRMKKVLILFILGIPFSLTAQLKFTINGSSHFYNNKEIWISPPIKLNDTSYCNWQLDKMKIIVRNSQFMVTGKMEYPFPLTIGYLIENERRFIQSNVFFIDTGSINIKLEDLTKNKEFTDNLNTKSNTEYQHLKSLYTQTESDSGDRYKILSQYIKANPCSYVALWALIFEYDSGYGYNTIVDSISQNFSQQIKSTVAFKIFKNKLEIQKKTSLFKKFPFSEFHFGESLLQKVSASTYTLIDFWASYCKPCIAQFPNLLALYNNYHLKGFDIYGICLDSKQNKKQMETVIQHANIPWINSSDDSGNESFRLNIVGIPSCFLVDKNGIILLKNVNPHEIEEFLKEKFSIVLEPTTK